MIAADRWIDRHLRRLEFGRFLQGLAPWMAGYLFLVGSVVLLVKLLAPAMGLEPETARRFLDLKRHFVWLGVGSIFVAALVWRLTRIGGFTRRESVALLDSRLEAGGLLMTLAERPDETWAEQLPQLEQQWQESLPRIRPVRFFKYLSLPLIFAVAAGFVPIREARPETTPTLVGQQATEQLEELLEMVDAADAIDKEEQNRMREEIERLADETEKSPLSHEKWETVDALRERLKMRFDVASTSVAKARSALATLAAASGNDKLTLSPERTAQLEKDVLETLQKMAENGALAGAPSELQSDLERLLKQGEFDPSGDPAARQELLDSLQEFLDQEAQRLAEAREKCGGENCPFCGNPQQGGT